MASDTQKAVEIALQLTGIDPKSVKPLTQAFKDLDTGVKNVQKTINTLQTTLNKIKPPASLKNIETTLKSINKIKLKDLSPLAANLSKLSKISNFPNIGNFVNNVQKLSTVSFAGFKALADQFKALERINIDGIVNKLRALNTAISALQKQGGLTAFGKFATDISQMKKALELSQGSVDRMTQSLKNVSQAAAGGGVNIRTFGEKVRTVLEFRMISEAIIAAKLAIIGARDAIIEYDQSLKDLQAITGATDAEVAQMGQTIIDVASTTKFSATEVAAGMRTIGQAGFTAAEAVQTMQGVSDLATGTLSDMSQVVDLVTTAMRVFNIQASDSTKVVDTFANAVNRSKLTIEKLRTAMNYVGPVAKDANITFQETAAAMMTLANSGLRASTIGTGLRRVFAELVDPSKKMKAAAADVGVSLMDLDPTANSLSSVLANLGIVLQDTSIAFDLFGKRGAAAAIALTTQGNQYNELLTTVSRTGTAAEQAAKQMEGLGVSFKNLQDKLKNLAIAMGSGGIATAMRIFVDLARVLVDAFTDLANTMVGKVTVALLTFSTVVIGATGAVIALKQALITSGIAAFIAKIITLTKTAVTTGAVLSKIFSPVGLVIGGLIVLITTLYKQMTDGAKSAARDAAELGGEYDNLGKKIDSYLKDTQNLKESSTELKNANLGLRQELLNVADGNSDLAESAKKAADSIDPLTGNMEKSKEALKEYQKEVNNLKLDNLQKAVSEAGDSLIYQTEFLPQYVNRFKDALGQVKIYGEALWETVLNSLSGKSRESGQVWEDAVSKAVSRGNEIAKGMNLSEQINEGTISWKELQTAINSFDTNTVTEQQKRIKDSFDELNNQSIKFINGLRESGQISLDQSVDSFAFLAENMGIAGNQLKSLLYMFEEMKTVHDNTISGILDKWSKGTEGEFSLTKDLLEFEEVYKDFGITLSEEQKKELKQIDERRKGYVALYNKLKEEERELREDKSTTTEAWQIHFQKVKDLQNEAAKDNARISKMEIVDQKRKFDQINAEYEKSLKENRENSKKSEEQKAQDRVRIIDQHEKNIQRLMKDSAGIIAANAEIIAEGFESSLDDAGSAFTKLEKKSKDAWTNIGKSSKLTLSEQKTGIVDWLNTITGSVQEMATSSFYTMDELGNKLLTALDSNAAQEHIDTISEALETASEAGSEAFEQMGENVNNVLDAIAAREAALLDNIEKYTNQIISVQKKVDDYRRSINQEQMSDLEVYQDDKLRAEELFAQAAQKSFDASMQEGEAKQKTLEEEKQLLEEAFALTQKLTASKKQDSNLDEKAQQERDKAIQKQQKIRELFGKEKIDQKQIAKLRQEIAGHNEKASKYDQEHLDFQNNLVSIEKSRQDRLELLDQYNERAVANREQMISAAESELAFWEQIKVEAESVKTNIEGLASALKDGVKFEADFSGAEHDLWAFKEDLQALTSDSYLTMGFTIDKAATQETTDEIVRIGNTWTNVWSSAETQANRAVQSMNQALKDIEEGAEFEVKFTGSGSEVKPITEKISDVKTMLQDFMEVSYDKIINISIGGYSQIITQFDLIIAKLTEIQDKEVTVKVNYESTGNEAEKRKIGGRIAGYGGGDKHPVLAEGGEWFIRKEAVKKYGDSFFAALNNMAIPKFQMGGKLLETAPSLNSVGNMETNNIVNNWNLTIGTETYAPRGKVKSIAEQLIAEVRGVY